MIENHYNVKNQINLTNTQSIYIYLINIRLSLVNLKIKEEFYKVKSFLLYLFYYNITFL